MPAGLCLLLVRAKELYVARSPGGRAGSLGSLGASLFALNEQFVPWNILSALGQSGRRSCALTDFTATWAVVL